MSGNSTYSADVFLSHATLDKAFVRPIATRLKDHGLRIWFDEESIPDGDNIAAAVEAGLQNSRVLVFFASRASLASDWASLERQTAIFRDPSNRQRRFVPVKIDDAQLPDALALMKYIPWTELDEETAFSRLLAACTSDPASPAGKITYHQVFTPGVPPRFRDLLVGRSEALKQLAEFLKSPGIHPIVIGDRGIGKTSLVKAAIDLIGFEKKSVLEANTASSFDDCCRVICADLGIPSGSDRISPATFLRMLKMVRTRAIISVDELDDIPKDSEIRRGFGVLTKAMSNHAHEISVKFVFSGIGRDAHELFGGHESSQRNLQEVHLKSIRTADLTVLLDRAFAMLAIKTLPHVSEAIATEADGFPYFVHQVGFHAAAAFIEDGAGLLDDKHLAEGRKRAVGAAFSHYLRRYKFTMRSLSEMERALLGELIGSNRRHPLIDDIASPAMLRVGADKEAARAALRSLREKGYVVTRRDDRTVALQDALVRPFLRIHLGLGPAKRATRKKASTSNGSEFDLFSAMRDDDAPEVDGYF